MRFLVDASLPRSTGDLLRSYGHEATDVRDIGMRHASDAEIAAYARTSGLAVITADFHFADIRQYPPADFQGLIVVDRPERATISQVLGLMGLFLAREDVLARVAGRLVIVSHSRIRLRPA